jgi:endonuclease-3
MLRLSALYPGTAQDLCELGFANPFQLLAATVLSAQTTDVRVNAVTPALFARYPSPADLAAADPAELEDIIHSTGFFRAKARNLIGLGRELEARFGGEVPRAIEDLVTLPGVGRKTANVIRSVAFDLPGLAVDTHVTRLTRLLGLTTSDDPVHIETDVCSLLPARDWGSFGLKVILHGRRVCVARRPRCEDCVLSDFCPSAGKAAPVRSSRPRRQAPHGPPQEASGGRSSSCEAGP